MLKVFSLAGMAGGLLRAIASFIPADSASVVQNADHLELFYVVIDLCLILGLVGIYLTHRLSLSQWGHWGFIISLCAFSFIAGPDAELFGASAYQLGTPIIGIGLLFFGVGLRQLESLPNYAADSMLTSVALAVVATLMADSILLIASGVLLGIAFMMNSYLVWSACE